MAERTYSEKLAQHVSELSLDRVPRAIIDVAKLHILDSLGCILAGSRLEPGQRAYQLAIITSGDNAKSTSTLLGTVEKVSYLDAVQAMATAAHCGELDDIHGGAATCIGAMVVPALLSMAEKHGGSGKRFLEATIVGYEAMARIGLSIDAPQLFARGWWPSTVCGAFGVAAAGAKFCNWRSDKIVNALGIASLHAGGMLTGGNEGATARHLAFGRAAQNGLLALLAGEQGLTGPKYAFEDARGFCLTLCAAPRWNYFQEWDAYHLPEVAFKPYPCARQLHAGVEALLTLMQRHRIAAETIAAIELSVPTHNADMVNRPATPGLRAATLGSGQYVMAVTAWRGKIDLESFEDRYLRSDDVRALMARVSVRGSADLDRYFSKYWSGRVSLKLIDGSEHAAEIIAPKGEPENPMTRPDIEEKFLGLATPVLGEEKARWVIAAITGLDTSESLRAIFAALAVNQPSR